MRVRVGVLTISDGCAAGQRVDTSGEAIARWADEHGFEMVQRAVVPDESDEIAKCLVIWSDDSNVDAILTTGGTGLGPRDVTPEATMAVVDRVVPGVAEAMRFTSFERFPRSILSRGIAGARGNTLIVNLPGSLGGVRDGLAVLGPVLQHAIEILTGRPTDH